MNGVANRQNQGSSSLVYRLTLGTLAALITWGSSASAEAQPMIKREGQHPRYGFEAEPHFGFRDPSRHNASFGPGFRGTVVIVDRGFIPKVNDSVGIGFGMDWLVLGSEHCHGGGNDRCHTPGQQIVFPVVMQWNFWLHEKWSVFAEPGVAFSLRDNDDDFDRNDLTFHWDWFTAYAGGRFHIGDSMALTMRIGAPFTASFGLSFLL
jgi:hypothetical protein